MAVALSCDCGPESDVYTFEGTIPCARSGRRGFSVRVLPRHQDLLNPQAMGLVCWQ